MSSLSPRHTNDPILGLAVGKELRDLANYSVPQILDSSLR